MTRREYDVIIVGARAAGAGTAMLLARQGLSVLAVDRARFPSDTLSTHQVQLPGVARLARWGCSTSSTPPAHQRYATSRSTSVTRDLPAPSQPSAALTRSTVHVGRFWTRSWLRRHGRRGPRSGRTIRWRSSSSTATGWSASRVDNDR